MDNISSRIREARERAGLTQKQLSEKTGISVRSIREYEKDASAIPVCKMQNIAAACEVDGAWLFSGVDQEVKKVSNGDVIRYQSQIEKEHIQLIRHFINKELAKELNENLVALEKKDPSSFIEINEIIKVKLKLKSSKQTGRKGGAKRKVNER